jgi:hypothetical protein
MAWGIICPTNEEKRKRERKEVDVIDPESGANAAGSVLDRRMLLLKG